MKMKLFKAFGGNSSKHQAASAGEDTQEMEDITDIDGTTGSGGSIKFPFKEKKLNINIINNNNNKDNNGKSKVKRKHSKQQQEQQPEQQQENNELISQLEEQEYATRRKVEELRLLHERFRDVQRELSQVQDERHSLKIAKQRMEKEKKELKHQLGLREKEVLSLVRRCSTQEERMREANQLQASRNSLSDQVDELRFQLTVKEDEECAFTRLQRELKQCNHDKERLKARLAKVKKDHDDVAENLRKCFQDMQKMAEDKSEREEEKQRERQRAELFMEKQRLEHLSETNDLKEDIQRRQEKIEQMEMILKDNMVKVANLRREKIQLEKDHEAVLSKLSSDHEEASNELGNSLESKIQLVHDDYARQLQHLRNDLDAKDAVISGLEDEVSENMNKLMAISSEMQRVQEETSLRCRKHDAEIAMMHEEQMTLDESLTERDREISILNVKLSSLESERNDLLVDVKRMEQRLQELEDENAFILDLEHQLNDLNMSFSDAEEQKNRENQALEAKLQAVQEEFETRRQMWETMEKGLVEKVSVLEKERNDLVAKLSANTNSSREVTAALETSVMHGKEQISSLTNEKEALHGSLALQTEEIIELKGNLENERTESTQKSQKIDELTDELKKVKLEALTEKETYSKERQDHAEEISSLQQELQTANNKLQQYEGEVEKMREEVKSQEDEEKKKTSSISSLEKQLAETKKALEILQDNHGQISANLRIEKEQSTSKIASLTDEASMKDGEIATLKSQLDIAEKSLVELKTKGDTDVQQLVEEKERLESTCGSEREIADELRRDIESLRMELSQKEESLKSANSALTLKSTSFEKLEAEMENVTSTNHRHSKRIKELESKLVTVGGESDTKVQKKEDEIKALSESIKFLQDSLSTTRNSIQQRQEEIEKMATELRSVNERHLKEKQTWRHGSEKQETLITSLQADLQTSKLELDQKGTCNASLVSELGRVREHSGQEIVEMKKIISEKETEVKSLSLKLIEQAKENQNQSKEALADMKEVIRAKDADIKALTEKVEAMKAEKKINEARLTRAIEGKDKEVENMTKRIEDLNGQVASDGAKYQTEIDTLSSKLEQSNLDVAILQDEIRDLKMIDLKEAGETIDKLEADLRKLRQEAKTGDKEKIESRISNLKAEVMFLQNEVTKRERKLNEERILREKSNDECLAEIKMLRDENSTISVELGKLTEKLKERHSSIVDLTNQIDALEKKEVEAQHEILRLKTSNKDAITDKESALEALATKIENMTNHEDDELENKKKCSKLQRELVEAQEELKSWKTKHEDLETVLNSRTALLADMVEQNKVIENNKEETATEIVEMKSKLEALSARNNHLEKEIGKLRTDHFKQEDHLMETIQKERQLREIAEVDLEKALSRIRCGKQGDKDLHDLERENSELRDKVKRQEAFLKRKIQKDKVLRERNSKHTLPTPGRLKSPRARKIGGSTRISRLATPSVLVSHGSSIVSEIDWDEEISLFSR